jgi:hypothetical protein
MISWIAGLRADREVAWGVGCGRQRPPDAMDTAGRPAGDTHPWVISPPLSWPEAERQQAGQERNHTSTEPNAITGGR